MRTVYLLIVASLLPSLLHAADAPIPAAPTPLPATQPVVRQNDKQVWIEGTRELRWGKTPTHTLLGAMVSATAATNHPCDYAAMLVDCGVAFRLRWYRGIDSDSWHGISAIVELQEEVAALERSTGWRISAKMGSATQMDDDIRKSIDAGRCVLGYVNAKEWDVGLIYGYDKKGTAWLVQDYYKGTAEAKINDPHDVMFFIERGPEPLPARDAMTLGMEMGLENWKRGEVPSEQITPWMPKAKYCFGEAAYEQIIDDLTHAGALPPDRRDNLHHVRAWVADNLADARKTAGAYLKENAGLLGDAAKPHLEKAAGLYRQIGEKIGRAIGGHEAFTFEEGANWSDAIRQKEIDILKSCLELDKASIAEIELALDAAR